MTASGSPIIQKKYDLIKAYLDGIAPELVPLGDANQITLPDLHGNVLGAMLRLEACGVLKIKDQEDRRRLAEIYVKGGVGQVEEIVFQGEVTFQDVGPCELTDAEFAEFKSILDRAEFHTDQIECVRFIGDVLGDRGKNDIFTLYLLSKLKSSDLHIEVNFSNHDLQFLAWHLAQVTGTTNDIGGMRVGQARSLDNFISFLSAEREQDEQDALSTEIGSLIDDYKSMVTLLQYSYDEKESPPNLKLYSHAPVGLEAIEGLCALFQIKYDESSPRAIAEIIDQINARFQELLTSYPEALFRELKRKERIHLRANGGFNDHNIDPMLTPLLYIAWNRSHINIRGPRVQSFLVENTHGHAGNSKAFLMFREHNGVKGTNLDFNNDLGYSEPGWDVHQGYLLGGPGPLNCYLSKGPILKPQWMIDVSRVTSEITRLLDAKPPNIREAYLMFLNEPIVQVAKKEVKEKGASCHWRLRELASLADQFWQSSAPQEVQQWQQFVVDAARVTSEIDRHLNDQPPNIKEAYWVFLDNKSIVAAAKAEVEAEGVSCHENLRKLASVHDQFWKNTKPPIDELKSKGVRKVISQITQSLQENSPNLQAAYRLVQNNKLLIDFAKNTIPKEDPIWRQDMEKLVVLAAEVENAVPSLWKRVCLGFLGGAVAGGLMGSFLPGIGNAFGGLIGGISGAVVAGVGFGVGFGVLGGWLGAASSLKNESAMGERASKILEKVNKLDMDLRQQTSQEFDSRNPSRKQTRHITFLTSRFSA